MINRLMKIIAIKCSKNFSNMTQYSDTRKIATIA